LAHWPGEIDAPFARLLIPGAPPAVLDAVLGRRPNGLKRALGHLPAGVLPRASYRQLIELLEEPATAALIYHVDVLSDEYIGALHGVPPPLRRVAARAASRYLFRPEGLMDGLRFLGTARVPLRFCRTKKRNPSLARTHSTGETP
jgi:hypothetical protein